MQAWLTPTKVAREFQSTAQKLACITDISESRIDVSAESLKTLHEKGVSSQTEICEASKQDIGHIVASHSLPAVQPSSSNDFTPKSSSWQSEDSEAISLDPFKMRHVCLKELELLWAEEVWTLLATLNMLGCGLYCVISLSQSAIHLTTLAQLCGLK